MVFFNDVHDGVHDVRAGFFVFFKMYFIQSERVYYTLMKKDIFLNNPCWFYAFSDFFFGLFDKNPLFQPWVVLIWLFKKDSYEIDVMCTAFIFDHCFLDTDGDLGT